MQERVFLTVDSGGSKTKFSLYTLFGTLIKSVDCEGFGRAADNNESLPALSMALKDFCREFSPEVIVCNLGGKNKKQVFKTIQESFPNSKVLLFRESEGEIGRLLCEIYDAQVTLMAGTGSIAIAPIGNDTIIAGGWGANVSDKGSGYQLGLEAIRHILEEFDGTNEFSMLAQKILGEQYPPKLLTAQEYCDYRDRVRQKIAPLERSHIASYAKIVYDCAENGDSVSLLLYKTVGKDLAELVRSAIIKTGNPLLNVVVTGGMVHAKKFWQESFENRLKEFYDIQKVVYTTDGIDTAMRIIAKKEIQELKICFQKA